jgi:hypothetical protein
MSAEATEELTNPDFIPAFVTPEERPGVSRREVRFEARCADLEEFIVAYEGFVDEDTLVLPHHPHLTIGGDCDFVIRLRRGGLQILRGRCTGLELVSDRSGFRSQATGVRVRVLEIDDSCREILQRLVMRRRFGTVADGRLARLQLLIQLAIPRPSLELARARSADRSPAASSDGPTIVDGQVLTGPKLVAPGPTQPPPVTPIGLHATTVTPVAAEERPNASAFPLAERDDVAGPSPVQPLLLVPRPPLRVRVGQWPMAAARRAAPLTSRLLAIVRPAIRRHGRIMLVALIGFALGFAARGGSGAVPPAATPHPSPTATEPAPAAAPTAAAPTAAAPSEAPRPLSLAAQVVPAVRVLPPFRVSGGLRRKHREHPLRSLHRVQGVRARQ